MLFYLLIFGYKHVLVVFLVNFCMCRLKARYPRTKAKFGLKSTIFQDVRPGTARRYSQNELAEVTDRDVRECTHRDTVAVQTEENLRDETARRYSQNELAEVTDSDVRVGTHRTKSQYLLKLKCEMKLREGTCRTKSQNHRR